MPLKFKCEHCDIDIIVKFLKTGEEAECKYCGRKTKVPVDAVGTADTEYIRRDANISNIAEDRFGKQENTIASESRLLDEYTEKSSSIMNEKNERMLNIMKRNVKKLIKWFFGKTDKMNNIQKTILLPIVYCFFWILVIPILCLLLVLDYSRIIWLDEDFTYAIWFGLPIILTLFTALRIYKSNNT